MTLYFNRLHLWKTEVLWSLKRPWNIKFNNWKEHEFYYSIKLDQCWEFHVDMILMFQSRASYLSSKSKPSKTKRCNCNLSIKIYKLHISQLRHHQITFDVVSSFTTVLQTSFNRHQSWIYTFKGPPSCITETPA